jgi:hypothetical protein
MKFNFDVITADYVILNVFKDLLLELVFIIKHEYFLKNDEELDASDIQYDKEYSRFKFISIHKFEKRNLSDNKDLALNSYNKLGKFFE